MLTKVPGLEAHVGHEHGIPEVPPGSIDQPISFSASADGSASVSSLLESVEAKRLTFGGPRVHTPTRCRPRRHLLLPGRGRLPSRLDELRGAADLSHRPRS